MPVAFFPHPFPTETVYSVCGRFHQATRGESPQETALLLFGDVNARHYTDVPSRLEYLQIATAGAIDATEHTLRARSGLGAYMALMPSTNRLGFFRACQKEAPSVARARSGLNRYVGQQSVLKLCWICAQQQLGLDSITWWNASHQCPGDWFCEQHRVVLFYVAAPKQENALWTLPHLVFTTALQPTLSVQAQLKLLRLASVVRWMSSSHHLETAVLQVMLKDRFRQAGLCASELKWRVGERALLEEQLRHYCGDLFVPDIQRLKACAWLRALLSGDNRHYDPLAWSLALSWHGNISSEGLAREYFGARARKPERELFDALPRRERRVSAPEHIYRALETSDFKKFVLEGGHITEYEIDSWLRRDPDLKKAWQRAIRQRAKTDCVLEIKTFLASHPDALRVDILKACNRAYRWLDANNPDQLHRLLPWVTPRHSRQLRLPWDQKAPISSERHTTGDLSTTGDAS